MRRPCSCWSRRRPCCRRPGPGRCSGRWPFPGVTTCPRACMGAPVAARSHCGASCSMRGCSVTPAPGWMTRARAGHWPRRSTNWPTCTTSAGPGGCRPIRACSTWPVGSWRQCGRGGAHATICATAVRTTTNCIRRANTWRSIWSTTCSIRTTPAGARSWPRTSMRTSGASRLGPPPAARRGWHSCAMPSAMSRPGANWTRAASTGSTTCWPRATSAR